jgi:hypothetical protein
VTEEVAAAAAAVVELREHGAGSVAAALQRMAAGLRLVRELHTKLVLLPDNVDVTRREADGTPRRVRTTPLCPSQATSSTTWPQVFSNGGIPLTNSQVGGLCSQLRRYEFISGGGATLLAPPPAGVRVSSLLAAAVSRALASPMLLPLAQLCEPHAAAAAGCTLRDLHAPLRPLGTLPTPRLALSTTSGEEQADAHISTPGPSLAKGGVSWRASPPSRMPHPCVSTSCCETASLSVTVL